MVGFLPVLVWRFRVPWFHVKHLLRIVRGEGGFDRSEGILACAMSDWM
jgi:hypothetical protein